MARTIRSQQQPKAYAPKARTIRTTDHKVERQQRIARKITRSALREAAAYAE